MQWFRLHNKLLNDPVVQGLEADQFKVYINLLCYASSIDRSGYVGTISETSFALRETIPPTEKDFVDAFAGLMIGAKEMGFNTSVILKKAVKLVNANGTEAIIPTVTIQQEEKAA